MIIFDLDDTLIDTTGSVTPFKMKEVLRRLALEGLPVPDVDQAYIRLLALNAEAACSKSAVAQFVKERGGDERLLKKGLNELTAPLPAGFSVSTTPNAKEILKDLSESHVLALVTGGHPPFQIDKLEKAGIDRGFFSKIDIPEDSIKKPIYEDLLKKFSLLPQQVLACGDRIAMDLMPAFELGFITVHMRWGRGKNKLTESWVHHSISDLIELKRIVNK